MKLQFIMQTDFFMKSLKEGSLQNKKTNINIGYYKYIIIIRTTQSRHPLVRNWPKQCRNNFFRMISIDFEKIRRLYIENKRKFSSFEVFKRKILCNW